MVNFTTMQIELANGGMTSLCSLSLVDYAGKRAVRKNAWLVRPPSMVFTREMTCEHGLTRPKVAGCGNLYQLWDEIAPCLENRIIVADNANHQVKCLIESFMHYYRSESAAPDRALLRFPDFDFVCLFRLLFEAYGEPINPTIRLCPRLGYKATRKSGLSMAMGCGLLVNKLFDDLEVADFMELKRKLNFTIEERFSFERPVGGELHELIYQHCLPRRGINPYFDKMEWKARRFPSPDEYVQMTIDSV